MAKDFVNSEQVEQARAVNLIDYLHRSEPGNIIRSAPGEYRLKDHDSLKISNGKFNWFSRGIGGTNAIDYLVKVRGLDFQDAVRKLAGDLRDISGEPRRPDKSTADKRPPPDNIQPRTARPQAGIEQANERVFALPKANGHNGDLLNYLKGRGIDENIIINCIKRKMLYQSTGDSCVFVGYDNHNVPKFACERGMKSDFKKDVSGSNKAYNFWMPPTANRAGNPRAYERLYVFEGAVDCLSHASIAEMSGADWEGYRLSLGGVSALALNTFLENNPQIKDVYLCLDNDKPGKEATERICMELLANAGYSHINVHIAPTPDGIGKDFNDVLVYMRGKIKEKDLAVEEAAVKDPGGKTSPGNKRREPAL